VEPNPTLYPPLEKVEPKLSIKILAKIQTKYKQNVDLAPPFLKVDKKLYRYIRKNENSCI
jgi:hypothetical protein